MQAHHRALESSAGMVTMFQDVVVAVLGDQCEPVSTKRAARENTRRTPGDFLTF